MRKTDNATTKNPRRSGPPEDLGSRIQSLWHRAIEEQERAGVQPDAMGYHLHVCPECDRDGTLEDVRCLDPHDSAFLPIRRRPGDRPRQLYKFCDRHVKDAAQSIETDCPVEPDVQILLTRCAERGISAVDVLAERISDYDNKNEAMGHRLITELATTIYVDGNRARALKIAGESGIEAGTLRVAALRKRNRPAPDKADPEADKSS